MLDLTAQLVVDGTARHLDCGPEFPAQPADEAALLLSGEQGDAEGRGVPRAHRSHVAQPAFRGLREEAADAAKAKAQAAAEEARAKAQEAADAKVEEVKQQVNEAKDEALNKAKDKLKGLFK